MNLKIINKLQNTLFIDDNLEVMSRMPAGSVDLIATDPPFNTAKFRSSKVAQYSDVWKLGKHFTDSLEDKINQDLISHKQKNQLQTLLTLMQAGDLDKDEPTANRSFIAFMIPRALEMQRILKDTGSLYWQCDPTMSHAIKLMLDIIFGEANFRNELIWHYKKWSNVSRHFQKNHDVIFFFSKSNNYTFNQQLPAYSNTDWIEDTIRIRDETGRLVRAKDASGKYIPRKKENKGVPMHDVFNDISWGATNAERTGYPTQKPLKLFERIIKTGSDKGQLVLDPFCGCATAPIAALKLGRNFIGIDVNGTAVRLIEQRLRDETGQGNLNSDNIDITYVVNKQLLQDSIADINQLIILNSQQRSNLGDRPLITSASKDVGKLKKMRQFSDLDKKIENLESDRNFLQTKLKQGHPNSTTYLPALDHPYFKHEPEMTYKQKQAWKRQQIKLNRRIDKTYKCPGYYISGRHIKCLTLTEEGTYPLANMTTIEIDRIVPASMGGKYTLGNIQAICNKCNRTKKEQALSQIN